MEQYILKYNPYAKDIQSLETDINRFEEKKKSLKANLNWFELRSNEDLNNNLEDLSNKEDIKFLEVRKIEEKINRLEIKFKELKKSIKSKFNPFNLFSSTQITLRKESKLLLNQIADLQKIKRSELDILEKIRNKKNQIEKDISRYNTFNYSQTTELIKKLDSNIYLFQTELQKLSKPKKEVDLELRPILKKLLKIESERLNADRTISKAKKYENRLNNAFDGRERAIIHNECERKLGDSTPRKIIQRNSRLVKKLGRDIEKLENRASQIQIKALRTIDKIVIDGNNMCYDGNNFIGLQPLIKLTSALKDKYETILIFDSDIRSLLRLDENAITAKFEEKIKVHIVATKQKADETILDLASHNKFIYIISNDRYVEYSDKEVVSSQRFLRHEIINNKLLIHDININLNWQN